MFPFFYLFLTYALGMEIFVDHSSDFLQTDIPLLCDASQIVILPFIPLHSVARGFLVMHFSESRVCCADGTIQDVTFGCSLSHPDGGGVPIDRPDQMFSVTFLTHYTKQNPGA